MDGFIEKAAQTLLKKFGARQPQALFVGLDAAVRQMKQLMLEART